MEGLTSDHITKSSNIPPKHGLSKVHQVLSNKLPSQTDKCPGEETCKRLGTFIEGVCAKRPLSTPPCQVSTVLLLDQMVNHD